jgi:UDP-GlcNAc:undecaprenyl-phosphate GlcNAc-1-phosphate transferase
MFKTLTLISLAVPLMAMGIPIFDTALAVVRRLRKGVPVFQPDREHLHHRLLDRGLSQRQTVFLLYGLSALLAVLALWIAGSVRPEVSVLLALGLGGSLWLSAWRLGLLHRTRTRGSEISQT